MCHTRGVAVREFGIRDLRNHTSKVLEAVVTGDSVYITNRGTRVVELRPVNQPRPIEALIQKAKQASPGDTGAFEELLAPKEAEVSTHERKGDALWG